MSWSIQVDNLSKRYRLGRGQTQKFESFYEVVTDVALAAAERVTRGRSRRYLPARIEAKAPEIQSEHMVLSESQFEGAPPGHFYALKDVSFRVDAGQRIGIIGKNGSGKSTLLKILSRITRPTEGIFQFRGRLISLLEIGTGFHPDLTGRENVYLNAKINGMSDRQIHSVFDEIVAFSELGVQIDMPIKRYSSGMYMRLAFSVAAHLDSEILVVDEVLAVGDTGFQKKCLDRMLAIGNSGRTLLFVSHDMDAVRKLCSSALELSHGQIVSHEKLAQVETARAPGAEVRAGSGLQSVNTAIADYSIDGEVHSERSWTAADAPRVPSGRLSVRKVSVQGADGEPRKEFAAAEEVHVCAEVAASPGVAGCFLRLDIASVSGRVVVSSPARIEFPVDSEPSALRRLTARIPAPFFNPGILRVTLVMSDLADLADACSVTNAVDIVIIEATAAVGGLAHAPEAPLGPSFDWRVT